MDNKITLKSQQQIIAQRTNSHKIKLRQVLKNKGSQGTTNDLSEHKNIMKDQNNPIKQKANKFYDLSVRHNKSIDVGKVSILPEMNMRNNLISVSKNTIMKLESFQTNRNKKKQYEQVMQKLNLLDQQAEDLIYKKIEKIKNATQITLKTKGKDEISAEIQRLVFKIKKIQLSTDDQQAVTQSQVKIFMDKKIKVLQKLLAENSIQSQALKKYYFAINASNHSNRSPFKKSASLDSYHKNQRKIELNIRKSFQIPKVRHTQVVCNQTTHQRDYHSPQSNQYQTYRYKPKEPNLNLQPLPRSSYNRQFLVNPKMINFSCKNLDNFTMFGRTKFSSSTYSKDFQRMKTQVTDYKQLDSYRNKIKKIDVAFNFRNKKQESEQFIEKSRRYIKQQQKMRYNIKSLIPHEANINKNDLAQQCSFQQIANQESPLQNSRLTTQAKQKFLGTQLLQHSFIKNRNLNNLKYNYKLLLNK